MMELRSFVIAQDKCWICGPSAEFILGKPKRSGQVLVFGLGADKRE
jgi:hypothetical protein